jgi:hypothetical protein
MPAEFHDGGLHFRYPENWQLERQDSEDGWTVSVQSPDTAFLMICLREDMPSTNQLADAALEALKEEYKELEADDCIESLAGQPAVGHDIRFFSLDLPNTCWTRSFYSAQGTVLVVCQINDLELAKNEPVLKAMCASLKVDVE